MSTGAAVAGRAALEAMLRGRRQGQGPSIVPVEQPESSSLDQSPITTPQALARLRQGQREQRTQLGEADARVRAARIRANAARIDLQRANRSGDAAAIAAAGDAYGLAREDVAGLEGAFDQSRDRLAGSLRARRRIASAQRTEDEASRLSSEEGAFVSPDDVLARRRAALAAQFGPALRASAGQTDAQADAITQRREVLQGGPEAVAAQGRGQAPVVNPLIDEAMSAQAVRLREIAARDRARAGQGLSLPPIESRKMDVPDYIGEAGGALEEADIAAAQGQDRASLARQRAELSRRLQTLPAEVAVAQGEQAIRDANGGGGATFDQRTAEAQARSRFAEAETQARYLEGQAKIQQTPQLQNLYTQLTTSIGQLGEGEIGTLEQVEAFDDAIAAFDSLSEEDQQLVRQSVIDFLQVNSPNDLIPADAPSILDRVLMLFNPARMGIPGQIRDAALNRRERINQFLRGG